eukprot:jgi/Bigna1/77131/fgenesh1_pg.46_\
MASDDNGVSFAKGGEEKSLVRRLLAMGFDGENAKRKAALAAEASKRLDAVRGKGKGLAQQQVFVVPGRLEVVGKHTDYCGGSSLLCNTNRGLIVLVRARDDSIARISSTAFPDSVSYDLKTKKTVPRRSANGSNDGDGGSSSNGHWSCYPLTALHRLATNFPSSQQGFDVMIASDLPKAAGMSSSSCVVCAVFLAMEYANSLRTTEIFKTNLPQETDFYEYLGCIENGQTKAKLIGSKGVGTFGGSEDHTAIMASKRAQLSLFRYRPTAFLGSIAVGRDVTFVIASSGVEAHKTGDAMEKYNLLSLRAAVICSLLGESCLAKVWTRHVEKKEQQPSEETAKEEEAEEEEKQESVKDDLARLKEKILHRMKDREEDFDEDTCSIKFKLKGGSSRRAFSFTELCKRLEHFVMENYVVIPRVCSAFKHRDYEELGKWVDLSQDLAEKLLGFDVCFYTETSPRGSAAQAIKWKRQWLSQLKVAPRTGDLNMLHAFVEMARETGAHAASAFGAGFGGSVWALVDRDKVETFVVDWKKSYKARFGEKQADVAEFFSFDPVDQAQGAFATTSYKLRLKAGYTERHAWLA